MDVTLVVNILAIHNAADVVYALVVLDLAKDVLVVANGVVRVDALDVLLVVVGIVGKFAKGGAAETVKVDALAFVNLAVQVSVKENVILPVAVRVVEPVVRFVQEVVEIIVVLLVLKGADIVVLQTVLGVLVVQEIAMAVLAAVNLNAAVAVAVHLPVNMIVIQVVLVVVEIVLALLTAMVNVKRSVRQLV